MCRVTTLQIGMGWFPEHAGGVDRYFCELVRHLPGVGVDVRGLVSGSLRAARDTSGVVTSFGDPADSTIRNWIGVRREVRAQLQRAPQMMPVAHFAPCAFPLLGIMRERPWIVHFHGPWAEESMVEGSGRTSAWARALIERTVYGRATRCIALSHAFATVLEQSYGVAPDRIRVIPGGVDVDRFAAAGTREDARRMLGWPLDRPIVLAVRRLVRRMGLDRLISALQSVRKSVPDALVLIAGWGGLASELEARIASAGVQEHVRLLGYVEEERLPLMYQAADLSIVPTVALEGFGLVVVESLAAGTPVLVTPIGGLPEVVRGLAAELVLPDASVGAIADGLIAALTGRMRLPSPAACSQFARDHYAWPEIAGQIGHAYQDVLRS